MERANRAKGIESGSQWKEEWFELFQAMVDTGPAMDVDTYFTLFQKMPTYSPVPVKEKIPVEIRMRRCQSTNHKDVCFVTLSADYVTGDNDFTSAEWFSLRSAVDKSYRYQKDLAYARIVQRRKGDQYAQFDITAAQSPNTSYLVLLPQWFLAVNINVKDDVSVKDGKAHIRLSVTTSVLVYSYEAFARKQIHSIEPFNILGSSWILRNAAENLPVPKEIPSERIIEYLGNFLSNLTGHRTWTASVQGGTGKCMKCGRIIAKK